MRTAVASSATQAHKRWQPLAAIIGGAISLSSAAALAYASRASASDLNRAQETIAEVRATIGEMKATVAEMKVDFKDAVSISRTLESKGQSIDQQLQQLNKHIEKLEQTTSDMKTTLDKVVRAWEWPSRSSRRRNGPRGIDETAPA